MRNLPVVALVGRPNVGKSTLFNRIIGARHAVVHKEPGVTRDRLIHEAEWLGHRFLLVDTGGIGLERETPVGELIREQAEEAIDGADVILLCLDVTDGVTALDQDVAMLLRHKRKTTLVVANKSDSGKREDMAAELWELGLGEPIPVSAEHGLGIGDLLERIVTLLPPAPLDEPESDTDRAVRVAVVGRPNAGKSSLVNRLIGDKRVIVSPVPGTTRDAVDVEYVNQDGRRYVLTDTAGLRRRTRIDSAVEKFGVLRALRAITRADVCVLVIDATADLTAQERRIARYTSESGRALVVAVSKWDLVNDPDEKDHWRDRLATGLGGVSHALVVFTSAVTGRGMADLIRTLVAAVQAYHLEVGTADLNRVLERASLTMPGGSGRGRLNIMYATQVKTGPPTFLIFVNDVRAMNDQVRRYLMGQLRSQFELKGTPIRLVARSRDRK